MAQAVGLWPGGVCMKLARAFWIGRPARAFHAENLSKASLTWGGAGGAGHAFTVIFGHFFNSIEFTGAAGFGLAFFVGWRRCGQADENRQRRQQHIVPPD